MSLIKQLISRNWNLAAGILFAACFLIACSSATYAGDKPLNLTFADTIKGDYEFVTGNSTYRGSLNPGEIYATEFDLTIPDDASIQFQRLYLYWTWSRFDNKAIYPYLVLNRTDSPYGSMKRIDRYVDNKGFVGTNDFFCGVDTYEVPGLYSGKNFVVISAEQAGPSGSSVAIQGMGILVVYETADGQKAIIQVMEGADLLFSSYGISPDMATRTLIFKESAPVTDTRQATLLLVAPSGGYSRSDLPDKNRLYVNWIPDSNIPPLVKTIVSVLFPTFKGKQWSDIFESDETHQIGIEQRDITPYLRGMDNTILVQDRGDYFQLSNAILSIKLKT